MPDTTASRQASMLARKTIRHTVHKCEQCALSVDVSVIVIAAATLWQREHRQITNEEKQGGCVDTTSVAIFVVIHTICGSKRLSRAPIL
eukprot:5593846-Pyramimonas_sp.AAC.2